MSTKKNNTNTKKEAPKTETNKVSKCELNKKKGYTLEQYKKVIDARSIDTTFEFIKDLAKMINLLADETKGKYSTKNAKLQAIKKCAKKIPCAFTDAVVANAVSVLLHMPEHWKRAWLKDVCELKKEDGK